MNNLDVKKELLQTIEDFKSIENGNQDLTQFIDESILVFNKRNYMLYVETIDGKLNIYAYKFIFDGENLEYSDDIDINKLEFPAHLIIDANERHEFQLSLSKFISILVSKYNKQTLKKIFIDNLMQFKISNGIFLSKDNTILLFATQQQYDKSINFQCIQTVSKYAIADALFIEDNDFNNMTQLQKIYNDAFYNCTSLANISCGNDLQYIKSRAFSKSSIRTIDLSQTNLSSIDIYAFKNCKSLISVSLPSTLYFIGYEAFSGCSNLQQINILSNIENLAIDHSFDGCSNLLSIVVNGYNIKDYVLSGESQFYFDANDNYKMTNIR